MVQMVTPSPTPSTDGARHTTTPAMRNTSSPWTVPSMSQPSNGQWHYGTPPADDGAFSSYHSTPNQQLTSSWPGPKGMDLRSRGSPYGAGHTYLGQDDEGDWAPKRNSRPAKRSTTKPRRKDKSIRFTDLEMPLSVWAENNNIQPVDIADFATRDIAERIARRDTDGYVKRNLNIFFLYKRAYSKVGQAWLAEHHPSLAKTQPPLVTLVGESWRKESDAFKSTYDKWSQLEKDGLKKAFPDYKYKPGMKKAHGMDEEANGQHSNHQGGLKRRRNGDFVDHTQGVSRRMYGDGIQGMDAVYPSQEHPYVVGPYGMGSMPMSMAHDAGPMITDQVNAFPHPSRAVWAPGMNDGVVRSVSPAPAHLSYQTADHVPVDPSLADAFSDYGPSREVSEEPGFVAPSQLIYSRVPSAEPMVREHSDFGNSGDWFSNPAMSRCASEEPWQGMPNAFLSSLPSTDTSYPAPDANLWHLDAMAKHEPIQGFAWDDAKDWEHDFDAELADFR